MKRRQFVKAAMAGGVLMGLSVGGACSKAANGPRVVERTSPSRALVVWYSQTGHTARIGRIVADEWRKAGLHVDAADYRAVDIASVGGYDMIALGTPVFYMEVPENFRKWVESLPSLTGVPVASFVTFGGHGDGQRRTSGTLLDMMAARGAAPVGVGMFGNMSTFAPTWSTGNSARTLKYRHLPNAETFAAARDFAAGTLLNARAGRVVVIDSGSGFDVIMGALPQVAFTKLAMSGHHIDPVECIACGECVRKCPTGAVPKSPGKVDSDRCIACMGCVNNCPTGAMRLDFAGKPLYGFNNFLRRNAIRIAEPELDQR